MPISSKSKEAIGEALVFNVDYSIWVNRLNVLQRRIVQCLIQGFKLKEIAKIVKATVSEVKSIVREIQEYFLNYFETDVC